ncbi:hypothetical protein SOVF_057690 [Spinacia oleracea]|uniref:adenylate kinase n=1 Tax=Spinacia oleracea TaxID=3562 RepID=A0A9R0K953_SPIOL|nr:probable adenylate kinase 7, mitochondrial [Spinacia oleracea]KNA19848.1 hypothetical protein SOVF_057690 [Spinacia oleracea]
MAGLGLLRSKLGLSPFTSMIKTRSFGAAAALQYEDDDDYYGGYDDRTVNNRRGNLHPMADGEGSERKRGVQWVIMGEPGAKKHVYAEWLSKLLEVPHISMAGLLRQQLHPRFSLYKQIESAVSQGMLVPEDIIFGLLSKRLEEGYIRGETGFILDGMPRTRTQAEILDQVADVDLVLNLKCTGKQLVDRKLQGGLNLLLQESQIKSYSEVDWKEKLRTYAEQSKPLEDYYRKQQKLLEFEVAEGLGETWKGLLSVLQLQHMDSSFQKLTA